LCELLPHLGYGELYGQLKWSEDFLHESNFEQAKRVIPEFLHPEDDRQRWKGYPFEGFGLTHYVGMSGVEDRNVVAAALKRSDPRAGIFGYHDVARAEDITDGLNQTIMVIGVGEIVAPWVQGGGATIRGAREPYFDDVTGFRMRGGSSQGGTAVMMADGSARWISADVDPAVFRAMCTIHGGETVDRASGDTMLDVLPARIRPKTDPNKKPDANPKPNPRQRPNRRR
jgi:hypothetical protein